MEYKKLGHIAKIQTGPFGSQLHQSDYKPTGIPCIMPCNIGSNLNIICDNIAYISEEDLNRLAKHKTQEGDIVYSRRGDIEKCAYISSRESGWLCGTGCLKVSIDSTIALPKYVAYLLSTPESKAWLVGNAVGTTMLNLNTTVLSDFPICLPDLDTQQKVVEIIDSIADKIELNKRINDNLEQQAQALYKSWFIDFEPFKDGKFEESEIGLIPEGWHVGKAEDFYEINIGKTPPRKEHEWFTLDKSQNIWVSISDLGSDGRFLFDSSEYLTDKAIQKHNIVLVPEDTVLLSFKLTIGRVGIAGTQLTTNEAIARFITNSVNREYTYFLLKNFNYSKLGSTSSIATAVNSKIIKAMMVLMPSNECLLNFKKLVGPIIDGIKKNEEEILRLTALRDILLPKLMSGELKINEIDC